MSIMKLNYPPNLIELWVKEDCERIGVPKMVKQGVEETEGEWIVFLANDTEIMPNTLRIALDAAERENAALVSFNEGELLPDFGNINTHFLIKRDVIPKIGGEIFDCRYFHLGVDNILYARLDHIGLAKHSRSAIINHNHFTKGAPFDEVYALAWNKEMMDHDRALLSEDMQILYDKGYKKEKMAMSILW